MKTKKMMLAMLAAMMILSGCTQQPSDSDDKKSTEEAKSTEKGSHMSFKEFDELSQKFYRNSKVKYTISVPPTGARSWLVGYSAPIEKDCFMLYDEAKSIGSEDFEYKLEDIKNTEDIIPKMEKQIVDMAMHYANGDRHGKLVVTNSKNVIVNGYDWIRAEAYIEVKEGGGYADNKIHMIIYSMMKDGHPMYIAGVDRTPEQNQLELVTKITDMSIETFHELETE